MSETAARIRWEYTDGGMDGYVGTLMPPVFRICDAAPNDAAWVLMAEFPGDAILRDDMEELKAEAERWLEEFVTSLGAVFPNEARPCAPCSSAAGEEIWHGPLGCPANKAGRAISDSQRWQVDEARDLLARWDQERFAEDGYGAERTLADQVRNLLAIVDQAAPDETALSAPGGAGERETRDD